MSVLELFDKIEALLEILVSDFIISYLYKH